MFVSWRTACLTCVCVVINNTIIYLYSPEAWLSCVCINKAPRKPSPTLRGGVLAVSNTVCIPSPVTPLTTYRKPGGKGKTARTHSHAHVRAISCLKSAESTAFAGVPTQDRQRKGEGKEKEVERKRNKEGERERESEKEGRGGRDHWR